MFESCLGGSQTPNCSNIAQMTKMADNNWGNIFKVSRRCLLYYLIVILMNSDFKLTYLMLLKSTQEFVKIKMSILLNVYGYVHDDIWHNCSFIDK